MTDKDYLDLMEFKVVHGALIPVNDLAIELVENNINKVVQFEEKTKRDLKYHRAYFALINYVYSWLPPKFTNRIPQSKFYNFLKHLNGKSKVVFEFKDGTQVVEYKSISFGRMSQARFGEYVKEQLAIIYEYLIHPLCEYPDIVIENIESEFKSYFEVL